MSTWRLLQQSFLLGEVLTISTWLEATDHGYTSNLLSHNDEIVVHTRGRSPSQLDGTKLCYNGHTLKFYVNVTPGLCNFCDVCGREDIEPPENVYRCAACDFDACNSCYAGRSQASSSIACSNSYTRLFLHSPRVPQFKSAMRFSSCAQDDSRRTNTRGCKQATSSIPFGNLYSRAKVTLVTPLESKQFSGASLSTSLSISRAKFSPDRPGAHIDGSS